MHHCSGGKIIYNTCTSNRGNDVLCNEQGEKVVVFGIISVKSSDIVTKMSVNPNLRLKRWEHYQIFIHNTQLLDPDSKMRLRIWMQQ